MGNNRRWVALIAVALIGGASTFWFVGLPHDAGRDVSGHGGAERKSEAKKPATV